MKVATREPLPPPNHRHTSTSGQFTQCQPPLERGQSRPDPCRYYSGVVRCGRLAAVCNSSPLSDTVQVCPRWPRLPGDCVNSPANLRKYPVGVFAKAAAATVPGFHIQRTSLPEISLVKILSCRSRSPIAEVRAKYVTWRQMFIVGMCGRMTIKKKTKNMHAGLIWRQLAHQKTKTKTMITLWLELNALK